MKNLIFVDVEAPMGVGAPSVGDLTCFGAVDFFSRQTFYGPDSSREIFTAFKAWLEIVVRGRPIFVSDNPAYDFQWINFYFWKYFGANPFGHSARRIGDFYAGLTGDFFKANHWKRLRVTKHDHNPVHDAMGNLEAFEAMLQGKRA